MKTLENKSRYSVSVSKSVSVRKRDNKNKNKNIYVNKPGRDRVRRPVNRRGRVR